MSQAPNIDGVLIQWGDRLFYPGNRIVRERRSRGCRASPPSSAPPPSASASRPPSCAARRR